MNDQPTERRRYPRIRSENTVLVRKVGPDTFDSLTKTKDLGPGGCSFMSAEAIGCGVEVELTISVGGQGMQVRGRVIHEQFLRNGTFDVGVQFLGVTAEDAKRIEALFEKPWAVPTSTE